MVNEEKVEEIQTSIQSWEDKREEAQEKGASTEIMDEVINKLKGDLEE